MLDCPSLELLNAFLVKQLAPTDLAQMETHLSHCPTCQQALGRLADNTAQLKGRPCFHLGSPSPPRQDGTPPPVEQLPDGILDGLRILPPQDPPSLGAIGPYTLVRQLGRGGMGVVYLAQDERLKRRIAVKMIRTAEADPYLRERFHREAEAVAQLQHPNIVQIYEVGEHDGQPFLVLEFLAGGTLSDWTRGQPQAPRVAAKLLLTLAGAIQYAHQHGIIHRDLKPANVLLMGPSGNDEEDAAPAVPSAALPLAKISDFGLAKQLGDTSALSQSGEVIGTPSYMAPEQARGDIRQIGPPTDVYALGALLYELLTGRPPFHCESALDTLNQVIAAPPLPPSALCPRLPRDLETICLKCLEKTPPRRYATAQALADDLQRFLEGRPIVARPVGRLELAMYGKLFIANIRPRDVECRSLWSIIF